MKKISLLIFVLTLLLSACQLEPKTLSELYTGDLKDVSKITIKDESTGFGKEVTNKDAIDQFFNEIKDTKFTSGEKKEQKEDSHYSVSLFENDEETFQFKSSSNIHPIIEQLYKSISTNTPDDAVKSFDFATNIRIIEAFEVNENKMFYVFEGEHEQGVEYFLANIIKTKHNSMWGWLEAMPFGHPDHYTPGSYISIENVFAGLNPISEKAEDDWDIIEIPDSEYYIWVKMPDQK